MWPRGKVQGRDFAPHGTRTEAIAVFEEPLHARADSAYLKRWLHDLLETEPPGENIVAFWFGLFDETAPDSGAFARLYLSGQNPTIPTTQILSGHVPQPTSRMG